MNETAEARGNRWVRVRKGRTLYRDTDAHVALILRTLGIDQAAWSATLDRYAATADATGSVDDRLRALALAFHPASPHALPVPAGAVAQCPACAVLKMRPIVARRSGDGRPPLVYGECARCGHGSLLAGAAPSTIYEDDAYFRRRGGDDVGYDDYGGDREYRQAKGARLLEWIEQGASFCSKTPSVLEVGSGFGFTLGAAMARGWRSTGVDINPAAAIGARALYGIETVTATLGEALEAGLVVGVHADRRLVQMRARARGLRVIFIDPEQYVSPDGQLIHYPVEAPQDEDLFVRATAHDALSRLRRVLSC